MRTCVRDPRATSIVEGIGVMRPHPKSKYASMCTSTSMDMDMSKYTYMCMCEYEHVYVHIYTFMHMLDPCMCVDIYARVSPYSYMHASTCKCVLAMSGPVSSRQRSSGNLARKSCPTTRSNGPSPYESAIHVTPQTWRPVEEHDSTVVCASDQFCESWGYVWFFNLIFILFNLTM